ncbi:NAD-dependent epimerase/dehydratase family protein [Photobacterium atrarenae]|uniref:NAD-dependent epimerase/dehydratase family protein n=1 Tax=Photobacterium atrarenae TaxID=865757 RepID=A0ABY5GD47_9GAMM|nr:NAD-dependent epimerase/dehydratase family protein [Photobacterium atrarenae]UTV26517.1 NAD-dependent epimerase/dehydratase family protein [Photobacterium atrarenae]
MSQITTVFLTGATGYVGSAVAEELQQHGYQVLALCRSSASAQKAAATGCLPVNGNIAEPELWSAHLEQVDAVIHTACGFEESMATEDRCFVQALASHATTRNTPLIVLYTNGCWTYGDHEQVITEQSERRSIDTFQWMNDNGSWLAAQPNIDLRVVSPANVIGVEEQYVPPIMLMELERNGQPTVPTSLSLTWSLVERCNLAELYRLVLEKGMAGEEYIGVGDPAVRVETLAQSLAEGPVLTHADKQWRAIYGDWTEGYRLKQRFSSQKAEATLGWVPKRIYADREAFG